VQFTPDLMPSDILGVSIYHKDRLEFDFQAGPIFTQILLADEINRSSPRTQSALLEAMAERQVSVEGETHALDELFFVIATQNPQSFQGTYPLPEAQLDRFSLCFDLGYLPIEDEVDLAMGVSCQGLMLSSDSPMSPKAVLDKDMVLRCRKMIENVDIHRDLVRYLVGMVQDTRGHSSFRLGVSPRSSMDLVVLSKALAWVDGQDFVSPEHIRELFIPVLEHRLLVSPTFSQGGEQVSDILLTLIDETPLPR
jgi:MoxR-like ATPase